MPRKKTTDNATVASNNDFKLNTTSAPPDTGTDKRKNNPEVGMVKPENDPDEGSARWCYDPHIDPALQAASMQSSPGGREGERYVVEVLGFDYFDTAKGELASGGKGEGWEKLKKNIRAELNAVLLEKFHGTKSPPFEPGENKKVAVTIVDDRGIESLKIIALA